MQKYNRMKTYRERLGLSQNQAASGLNIAQNTLSQYENGVRNIPNEVLARLAVLYGTSTDYLLELTDDPKPFIRKNDGELK